MPKIGGDTPDALKTYIFHGVQIRYSGGDEAVGECPLCGKANKFYVNATTSQWDCKVCGESGNAVTFLEKLWQQSYDSTPEARYEELASDRGLLYSDTLVSWNVVVSHLTGEWLLPAYNSSGNIGQMYKYSWNSHEERMVLLATPQLNHHLYGLHLYDEDKEHVLVAEGPWDAMALWETLGVSRRTEEGGGWAGKLQLTGSAAHSLQSEYNVVAVPSCNTFSEKWLSYFEGKHVTLLFDNDHPRSHPQTGAYIPPAGYAGMQRACQVLAKAEDPVESISYLQWGEEGYDPELPSGFDVRDMLTDSASNGEAGLSARINALGQLLARIQPIPEEWLAGRTKEARKSGGVEMACVKCESWKELSTAWKTAMRWTDGLDRALACMLACVTSTKSIGDQLWFKVLGPPASGKSTLCEAVSVSRKYVVAKSTIRGFHSGYKSDGEGKEDNSLLSMLYDKTLVTKDGDTLLQSPNLGQILSEARDIYDGTSRTHYRHGMSRDYQGMRVTWVLCGTSSLRSIDSSELGERFLDCVIMEEIDEVEEDAILMRVAGRAERNMGIESNGKATEQHDPDLVVAMQLTGGYVEYLRGNAQRLLNAVLMDDDRLRQCTHFAKFVAYMRARPSKKQEESVERELASRLTSQLVRLAKCIAVVINRDTVDDEVMRRVRKVALDTSRGRTLNLVKCLYAAGKQGETVSSLAVRIAETEDKTRALLTFLLRIKVAELFALKTGAGSSQSKWRLTESVRRLYREVMNDGQAVR